MYVINIVNSFIGKKGNIGLRTAYIIDELNKQSIKNFTYSRGAIKKYKKNNMNMGFLGYVPRILNAYRIYFNPLFNHRKYDIWLFEKWFEYVFKDKGKKNDKKIAHIWEYSPKIIKKLKKLGYITILDVPIAPTSTEFELKKKYPDLNLYPHKYNLLLELKSFQLVDYILVPSLFVKEEILKLRIPEYKIFVIPFGVDVDNITKEFSKDYKKEGIDFCFAGNISSRKGINFLLEAWDSKEFKNDRLHLCGRLYPEIKQILKKKRFKNVILPGFVDTKEYFKNCDVYVFPSLLEGSSKSIYEAMNRNMPCIVTYNSGSIIDNGIDGFIINIADVKDLREKMLYFKKYPYEIRRMGKAAKEKIKKYTWNNYARNIINLYKEVLS